MRIRACLEVAKGDSDAFATIVHIVLQLGAVAPPVTQEFNLVVAVLPNPYTLHLTRKAGVRIRPCRHPHEPLACYLVPRFGTPSPHHCTSTPSSFPTLTLKHVAFSVMCAVCVIDCVPHTGAAAAAVGCHPHTQRCIALTCKGIDTTHSPCCAAWIICRCCSSCSWLPPSHPMTCCSHLMASH